MGVEFMFTLEIEVELIYNPFLSIVFNRVAFDQINAFSYISVRSNFSTPFTDIIYTIIEGKNII